MSTPGKAWLQQKTQEFSVDPLINRKIKSAVEGLQQAYKDTSYSFQQTKIKS
jgi:hypothetical protein